MIIQNPDGTKFAQHYIEMGDRRHRRCRGGRKEVDYADIYRILKRVEKLLAKASKRLPLYPRSFRSSFSSAQSPCPSLAFLASELTSLRRLLELAFLTHISSLLPSPPLPPELVSKIFHLSQRAPKPFSLPPLTSSGPAWHCESLQREKLVTLLDLLIISLPRLPRSYSPSLPALQTIIRALVQDVGAWRPLLEQGIEKMSTSPIFPSEISSKHLFSSFSTLPSPSPRQSNNSVSCYLSRARFRGRQSPFPLHHLQRALSRAPYPM